MQKEKRIKYIIIVMKEGELIESNTTSNIFSNPQHNYTKELVNFRTSNYRSTVIDSEKLVLETSNLYCKYLTNDSFFKHKSNHFRPSHAANPSRHQTFICFST